MTALLARLERLRQGGTRKGVRHGLAALVVVALLITAAPPPSAANADVIARIRETGFSKSQVMDTVSWLSDVYGPRLTGTPALREAAEWAARHLSAWGLSHAEVQSYGPIGRGWILERYAIEVTAPHYVRVNGYPRAWSPPTASPIAGVPTVVTITSPADFDRYRGTLRGAIVMNGRPEPQGIGFTPDASRFTDDDLRRRARETNPASPAFNWTSRSFWDDAAQDANARARLERVWRFLADEGIAALVTPSDTREAVRVTGFFDRDWRSPFPAFVIAREDYGRIVRMLDRRVPVTLSLSLAARFDDHAEGVNVVAEIPGVDPGLKDQVVMLGGHLDSWHAGTGATDNAAGVAAALEAVRILQAAGAKPRRTIRIALWGGEEQDYGGSLGYVKQHFGDPETMTLRPEHAKLSAYFNLDDGAGRIRGIDAQANAAARPLLESWLAPLRDLGAGTTSILSTGSTDHVVFDAVGLPAFCFVQDPLNYEARTHHTNLDVYEQVIPEDLKQAAVVLATVVYEAAMADAMVPRKPLPPPHARTATAGAR